MRAHGAASLRTTNPQLATTLDAPQPPVLDAPGDQPGGGLRRLRRAARSTSAACRARRACAATPAPTSSTRAPDTTIGGAAPPFTFSSDRGGLDVPVLARRRARSRRAPRRSTRARRPGRTRSRSARSTRRATSTPRPRRSRSRSQPPPTPTPTPTRHPDARRRWSTRPSWSRRSRARSRSSVPGSQDVRRPRRGRAASRSARRSTRARARVELTSIPKAGAPPEKARFYDGIFKVTQSQRDHEPHADRGARGVPEAGPRERRGQEAEDAQAVG